MTIAESPLFREVEESDTKADAPILEVLRRYPKQVLLAIGARVGVDVAFYTFVLFITTYVATYLELPRNYALNAVLIAAAVQVVAHPVLRQPVRPVAAPAGLPGGRDRRGGLGLRLLRPARHRPVRLIVLAAVVALFFHAAMYGPQAAFIAEMFPTKVRYTGASMGYQLAGIIGGALAPIISVALLDRFDTSIAVSVYAVVMLPVTIICVLAGSRDLEDRPARRPREPADGARERAAAAPSSTSTAISARDSASGRWATTRRCWTSSPAPTSPAASTPATPTSCAGSARQPSRGVAIGAQVSYRDLAGFGRRSIDVERPL